MIGIFDSGIGGLSVALALRALDPGADILYLSDAAWCPYGELPEELIRDRAAKACIFLENAGAHVALAACNTATAAGIEAARRAVSVPVVGIEPGIKPAALGTESGTVAVFATEAFLASPRWARLAQAHAGGARIAQKAMPHWVRGVEELGPGAPEEEFAAKLDLDSAVRFALASGADRVLLGCTHFSFLAPALARKLGGRAQIVDVAPAVAKRALSLDAVGGRGRFWAFCTGSGEALQRALESLGWPSRVEPAPDLAAGPKVLTGVGPGAPGR